jgi:hypothetical protein
VEPLKLVLSIILLPLVVLLIRGTDACPKPPNVPTPLAERKRRNIRKQ